MIPSSPSQTSRPRTPGSAHAFTAIEMLVVISIIGILFAITMTVGVSMIDAGKRHATTGIIQALDQSLNDYISTTGSIPPELVRIRAGDLNSEVISLVGSNNDAYYPVIDGVIDVVVPGSDPVRHVKINSVGLYLYSLKSGADVETIVSNLDNKFVRTYDLPGDLQPELLTVFDAWGNPIRYVHPKFDGIIEGSQRVAGESGDFLAIFDTNANSGPGYFTRAYLPVDLMSIPFISSETQPIVRRNKILTLDQELANATPGADYPIETDSDGGTCSGQHPYFYSAGPDGDPATIQDNIYTTRPTFVDPL